ncbi:MAG TPA: hypothetical protein VI488_17760, partial [Candidatus Angelobacter sp.]
MKSGSLCFTLALFCLAACGAAQARDIVVPAGTLMTCTLDEPKFSSATVSVGDPFLCYPRTMQQFGQVVFPRGTYLVGHLESDKEPGHFVGKGYLKLAFDRLGLPTSDLPLTAKVIAVDGFNVNRQGKIIGHGHATRDVVEWMLPPLWPWKVLTLPARGPRPTLKGEVRITLRVMDDIIVPQTTTPGWHRFGEPSSFQVPSYQSAPQPRAVAAVSYQTVPVKDAAVVPQIAASQMAVPQVAVPQVTDVTAADLDANTPLVSYAPIAGCQQASAAPQLATVPPGVSQQVMIQPVVSQQAMPQTVTAQPVVSRQVTAQPVMVRQVMAQPRMATVSRLANPQPSLSNAWAANVTLFALADGTVFPATQYWRDQDQLWYVSDGHKGTVAMSSID